MRSLFAQKIVCTIWASSVLLECILEIQILMKIRLLSSTNILVIIIHWIWRGVMFLLWILVKYIMITILKIKYFTYLSYSYPIAYNLFLILSFMYICTCVLFDFEFIIFQWNLLRKYICDNEIWEIVIIHNWKYHLHIEWIFPRIYFHTKTLNIKHRLKEN